VPQLIIGLVVKEFVKPNTEPWRMHYVERKNAKENISEDKIYFLDCGHYFPYLSPKLI